MTRGEYITRLRKERNLTQDEVAEKLFIDRSVLSRYESDIIEMDLDAMKDMAKLYKVEVVNIIYSNDEAYKTVKEDVTQLQYEKFETEKSNLLLNKELQRNKLIAIIITLSLILLFFINYFYYTYNSIYMYELIPENEKIKIGISTLTLTSDKVLIMINNIEGKYDKFEFILKDINNNEILIKNFSDNKKHILSSDSKNVQRTFNFKTIKKDINNLYLKVYNGNNYEYVKLNLQKIYNNDNLVFFDDNQEKDNKELNNYIKIKNANYFVFNENVFLKINNEDKTSHYTYYKENEIISYYNKKTKEQFEYNIKKKKYTSGKENNEKLELFFELYELYRTKYDNTLKMLK